MGMAAAASSSVGLAVAGLEGFCGELGICGFALFFNSLN